MENFDAPFDDNYEIDAELWLQCLLAMTSGEKEILFDRIMKKTGLPYEKVELAFDCTLSILVNRARSN